MLVRCSLPLVRSYSGGGSTRMCAFPPLPREGAHDTSKGKRSKMRKKKKLSGSGSTIGSRSESRASESGSAVFVPAPLHNLEQRYEIIRHFEFSPEKPRSGTLLRRPSGQIVYLVKGSPESIAQLSDPSSLPPNMTHILGEHACLPLRLFVHGHAAISWMVLSFILALSFSRCHRCTRHDIRFF